MTGIIATWHDGDMSDLEALRELTAELADIEASIAPLDAQRKTLRNTLEVIATRLGGRAETDQATMVVTEASETVSYDPRACDALIAQLAQNGQFAIAEALAGARRTSRRAGGLRLTWKRD